MNKKNITCIVVAMMACMSANAQIDLGNILKNAASSIDSSSASSSNSSSTGLLSSLTSIFSSSKTASVSDLVGTWSYTEPAVVFSSSSTLKNVGGKVASAAIEKKLQTKLSKYGITKGKMKMTFDKSGNFTQTINGKTLKGTYTVSGKNVVLKYGGSVSQIAGTTQVEDNSLLIVMNASKMLKYMKTLGSLTSNSALKTASSLVGSMDGMQCGLRLTK